MSNDLKRTYEALFLVDSAVATANWDEVIDAIKRVFDRSQAEVISCNKWDERRLAYEVAGRKRGTYILCYFNANPQVIQAIERDVQLSELLLRVMILRVDHLTEELMKAPTPAMQAEKVASGERDAAAPASTSAGVATGDAIAGEPDVNETAAKPEESVPAEVSASEQEQATTATDDPAGEDTSTVEKSD